MKHPDILYAMDNRMLPSLSAPDGSPKTLSVVVPAFDEESRIGPALERIVGYLRGQAWDFELIVVDDGSRDATLAIARAFAARDPAVRVLSDGANRGKGFAVRHGMSRAAGGLRLFCDADLSTPIEEIERLLPWLARGYDVAIGSRALPDSRVEVRQSALRESLGKSFGRLAHALFGLDVHDSQCGFKLFTARAAALLFDAQRLDGYAFDVELLLLARRFGLAVREVGIRWRNDPGSHVSLLSTPPAMIREMAALAWRFGPGDRAS